MLFRSFVVLGFAHEALRRRAGLGTRLRRAVSDQRLNISPQQMKYVTHTESGEGLLFYGNVILPFVDHFPKDTKLYKVMTTKPEEVSSE